MTKKYEKLEYADPTGLVIEDAVVKINRCATVVKGGRRFSFSALVVVGDGKGVCGYGFGKAKEVPLSVEKAVKDGKKRMVRIPLVGATVPHEVVGRFGATRVFMGPARPGTGITAGPAVRALLEAAGVHDILTKTYGSCNPVNVVRATMDGLLQLRRQEQVDSLRGIAAKEA
jgi:small subunit ribosomal protein S5